MARGKGTPSRDQTTCTPCQHSSRPAVFLTCLWRFYDGLLQDEKGTKRVGRVRVRQEDRTVESKETGRFRSNNYQLVEALVSEASMR